ncbi:hypothetical protein [Nocardiopsis tropica]|uniref:Uncharacterized protein n=1 Tax=Nocardiopsis tropica TaxID=109330 RepID=A0ABU7KT49_9ACTN|nr:hypothetical protein [Nocardiopsis umidischolae]MEE2052478.1 hypothetical protein [Nocardiopsis umidischolae]
MTGAPAGRARGLGAREGLLVASREGRPLYGALGRRVRADVVTGSTPGPAAAGEAPASPAGRP